VSNQLCAQSTPRYTPIQGTQSAPTLSAHHAKYMTVRAVSVNSSPGLNDESGTLYDELRANEWC